MKLIDSSTPLSDGELARFAALFDDKLPEAFLRFYQQHNGGYLREEDEEPDPSGIDSFIPATHGDNPIEALHQTFAEGFAHLVEFVPFAADRYGNCYLLSLRDQDYGHAYLHLLDGDELVHIAGSFAELIDDLQQRAGAASA